nr:DUF5908 family protein [uncultured Desulfobacter sp.]
MAIEINDLKIKGAVKGEPAKEGAPSRDGREDLETMKKEILSQCRDMIREMLDQRKER